MTSFLAHLHPLLVHLPIGILLPAVLFDWLSLRERYASLKPAVPVLLRFGALSAVVACGSGWLLGQSGDYDADMLWQHQWLGLATAAAAITACFAPYRLVFSSLSAVLIVLAGHAGGSLTHGAEYLNAAFQAPAIPPRPLAVQEAAVFEGVIAVLLQEKCVSCHGAGKQKGELRLDSREALLKGGKSGATIVPGNAVGSELMRRCLLPMGHDEHMPPKEKPQLSAAEVDILQWWLNSGAGFDQKVRDLPQPASVRNALASWAAGPSNEPDELENLPDEPMAPAPAAVVQKLQQAGVLVLPLAQNSRWLEVNFINLPQPHDSVFPLLAQLAPQLMSLKLSGCQLPESAWPYLGKMTQLRRLALDNTPANDAVLQALSTLQELRILSLAHTQVSSDGVNTLSALQKLQRVYLFGAQVRGVSLPGVVLDTGRYQLPFLKSDTARLKGEY